MVTKFPIGRPTTKDEFQGALRTLIESADESEFELGIGWGFRTDWNGWSIEIVKLEPADGDSSDSE